MRPLWGTDQHFGARGPLRISFSSDGSVVGPLTNTWANLVHLPNFTNTILQTRTPTNPPKDVRAHVHGLHQNSDTRPFVQCNFFWC